MQPSMPLAASLMRTVSRLPWQTKRSIFVENLILLTYDSVMLTMNLVAHTNLIIVLVVTIYGVYWLVNPPIPIQLAYRYRAYCYWWCSWLAWIVVWLLLSVKHTRFGNTSDTFLPLDIPILIFDNLNSIFLVVVYFVLTRGLDLTANQARLLTFKITLSIAGIYGSFYLLFYNEPQLAYEIHRSCSVCVAVLTPILVGWAFNLRFNTSTIFMIGCLYGFAQPIVYATQLRTFQESGVKDWLDYIQPIVTMLIGFLKVVWAIACTKVLSSAHASAINLIQVNEEEAVPFWKGWSFSVGLHATILIAVYCILLISLTQNYEGDIRGFAAALGVVTGIFSLWQTIWNVWKTTRR